MKNYKKDRKSIQRNRVRIVNKKKSFNVAKVEKMIKSVTLNDFFCYLM